MQLWLVLLGSALALGAIAILAELAIEFDLRGRGEATGAWFAAFGVAGGPLALAGVVGRGAPARLELHCFGVRVDLGRARAAPKSRTPAKAESSEPPPEADATERPRDIFAEIEGYARLALDLRHRISLDGVGVDLTYGFHDVALTGRIFGALAVLSAILPNSVRITQTPLWTGSEQWEVRGQGRLGIGVGLVLTHLLWYMLGRRFRRARVEEAKHGQDEHLRNRG